MGLGIKLNHGTFSLASSNGWLAFANWAESQPDAPKLKELCTIGGCVDTEALRVELEVALESDTPIYVADTAQGLLDSIGMGDPTEEAVVVL